MTGLRPLSIGEILDGAFSIYRRHFVVLLTTAGVLTLPGVLLQVEYPLIAAILSVVGGGVGMIAITLQASDALLGGKPDLASTVSAGFKRLIPVWLKVFAMSLLLGLVTVPLIGGVVVAARAWMPERSGLDVVTYIGIVALLAVLAAIPPSYLALRWFAVAQIAILEPTRHFLRRSSVLSHGALTKISVVWSVGFLLALVPGAIIGGGQGVVTVMVREGVLPTAALIATLAVGWIVSALTTVFLTVLLTLLYYDQRVRKDGLDVELAVSRAVAPSAVPQPAGT
jgi:hypothetical protein